MLSLHSPHPGGYVFRPVVIVDIDQAMRSVVVRVIVLPAKVLQDIR